MFRHSARNFPFKLSMKALSGMIAAVLSFTRTCLPTKLRGSGPRGTGSTQVRAGRRTDMNREFEVVIWPPQRLAWMRCERGSVIVVLPACSLA